MSVAKFRSLAEMYGTLARPASQWLLFDVVAKGGDDVIHTDPDL